MPAVVLQWLCGGPWSGDLLEGEQPSPLQRAGAAAGAGVSPRVVFKGKGKRGVQSHGAVLMPVKAGSVQSPVGVPAAAAMLHAGLHCPVLLAPPLLWSCPPALKQMLFSDTCLEQSWE